MVRAGEFRIERQVTCPILTAVKTDRRVRAAARYVLIDRLADARLELDQIARQIYYHIALFPVHGIQLDAEFRSGVIGLATTVSSHASHISVQSLSQRNGNVQRSESTPKRGVAA